MTHCHPAYGLSTIMFSFVQVFFSLLIPTSTSFTHPKKSPTVFEAILGVLHIQNAEVILVNPVSIFCSNECPVVTDFWFLI